MRKHPVILPLLSEAKSVLSQSVGGPYFGRCQSKLKMSWRLSALILPPEKLHMKLFLRSLSLLHKRQSNCHLKQVSSRLQLKNAALQLH